MFNNWQLVRRAEFQKSVTCHDDPHVLDKAINDLESLGCGGPRLVQRESIKSLQHFLNVMLSQEFLHKFDCALFGQLKCLRGWQTYLVAFA